MLNKPSQWPDCTLSRPASGGAGPPNLDPVDTDAGVFKIIDYKIIDSL